VMSSVDIINEHFVLVEVDPEFITVRYRLVVHKRMQRVSKNINAFV
jgi:hypothetical protein